MSDTPIYDQLQRESEQAADTADVHAIRAEFSRMCA